MDICEKDLLSVTFESSAFRDGWEGILEFRFKTGKVLEFQYVIRSLGARQAKMRSGYGTCLKR